MSESSRPCTFSVVVPTFNRPEFLAEAVESVLKQTVDDFELVVVNDGGSPVARVDDERFRLIAHRENRGVAAALNTGIRSSTGRFVTFMNDDDVLAPARLEIALEGLDRAPIALCLPAALEGGSPRPRHRQLNGWVHDTVIDDGQPSAVLVALERRLALPFDEQYMACEDVEWWIRVSRLAPVATVPRVGYFVREHPGPRGRHGERARLEFNRRLLVDHAEYFETHHRARAFRYKRIALREWAAGDRSAARAAFRSSFRASPSARTLWHLARTFLQSSPG